MDTFIKFIYVMFSFFVGGLVFLLLLKIVFKMLKDLEDRDR